MPKAAAYLAAHPPDLIMSTHWACSHLFSLAQGSRKMPLYYIYGELRATYSVVNCGADRYFRCRREVERRARPARVSTARIRQVPLVVDPHMVTSDVPRDVLRRGLGIPPENLVVVLSLGGEGIGRTLPFIEAFARDVRGATLVVLTGRNAELLSWIQGAAPGS